eukprot:275109_1
MAQPKKDPHHHSFLSLICPGSGNQFGTSRKVAKKTDNKANAIKSNIYIKYSINLQGSAQDDATMTKYVKSYTGSGIKYKSNQSVTDAQLTVYSAKQRIRVWMKEEGDSKQFYFSGHGSNKKGGGICFKDGILLYSELEKLTAATMKGKNKLGGLSLIIDACYSGYIVDAFQHYEEDVSGGGYDPKLNKPDITLMYSCQKNQVSADLGTNGGYFTQKYFTHEVGHMNLLRGDQTVTHEYMNGTVSKQTPGTWASNPLIW